MSSETNHFSKMTIFISCLWTTANPPPTVRHRPNIGEIGSSSDRQHDAGGHYGINGIRSKKKIKKKTDRGRFIAVTSTVVVYEHFRLKRVTIARIFCLRPPPEFLSNEPCLPVHQPLQRSCERAHARMDAVLGWGRVDKWKRWEHPLWTYDVKGISTDMFLDRGP